jgi:nicotinamidase/pyrazinamidase
MDALQLGFNVFLINEASRGVNLKPGDVDRAVAEMVARGVKLGTLAE